LVYLHYRIAAILAFIGIKLFVHARPESAWAFLAWGHSIPEVPTWRSLSFIVVAMAVATIASRIKMNRDGIPFREAGPESSETEESCSHTRRPEPSRVDERAPVV